MLNIGKITLIDKFDENCDYALAHLLNFYELTHKNILYTHLSDKPTLSYLLKCNKKKINYSNYADIIKDNLFNIDILVIDYCNSKSEILEYSKNTEISSITNSTFSSLNIPIIFLSKKHNFVENTKITNHYIISVIKSEKEPKSSNYLVEDVTNGWKSNMYDIELRIRRDLKLNILGL